MNRPLIKALKELELLQKNGSIFKSEEFSLRNASVLKTHGFLAPVIRGWYNIQKPGDIAGSSTAWYANFWEFVAKYLDDRFGRKNYCLNADASLLLHTGKTVIPKQIVVITREGSTSAIVDLPFGTSLAIYKDEKNFPQRVVEKNSITLLSLEDALCKTGEQFFINHPLEAEIALNGISDASAILNALLTYERMDSSASRMAGAFEYMGRHDESRRICETYTAATGIAIKPKNPFIKEIPLIGYSRERSPYAARIYGMWASFRSDIVTIGASLNQRIPDAPYVRDEMTGKYQQDAYHSLSIEGYIVTPELISKIEHGLWNPDENPEDKNNKDALAAKGYFDAYELVKKNILESIEKSIPIETSLGIIHHDWYRSLFTPSVASGMLRAQDLAGYRNSAIYLITSMHVPPPKEAVIDSMSAYFELLKKEEDPFVRAVLGHFIFGFIHPYVDGNGRMARFIMNALLVTNGFPWIIIQVQQRNDYLNALEEASAHGNIKPFAQMIADLLIQAYPPLVEGRVASSTLN